MTDNIPDLEIIVRDLDTYKTALMTLKKNILHHESVRSTMVTDLLEKQEEYECLFTRRIEDLRRTKQYHTLKEYIAWYGGYLGIACHRDEKTKAVNA